MQTGFTFIGTTYSIDILYAIIDHYRHEQSQ